jgi:translation initiation factor 2A
VDRTVSNPNMASFLPADLPQTQVLVRTRDAIKVYNGPVKVGDDGITASLNPTELFATVKDLRSCPVFSPNGSIVCYLFENKPISLCSTASSEEVLSLSVTDAEYVEFSPSGTYLVTWSRPTKGSATGSATEGGNMRVWNATTGELVTSFSQKAYKTQIIQWTANEEYCCRLVSNEVQIFTNGNLTTPSDKVYHKGLTQFHITPTTEPYISLAVFNPESGGKPARVTLYRYNPSITLSETTTTHVEGPVSSRTIFAASEAKLTWNATGSALLVYAHADTDATSYYGATGLFLLQAHTDAAIKVRSLCSFTEWMCSMLRSTLCPAILHTVLDN